MKTAVLRQAERARFEVQSIPSRGHPQKWYMKANHPVEAHRWTEAISKSIDWYKQREGATDSDASSVHRRKSAESDSSGIRTTPSMHSQTLSTHIWRKNARDQDSMLGSDPPSDSNDASPNMMSISRQPTSVASLAPGHEDGDDEDSSSADSEHRSAPHQNIELHGNAASAQLELTVQLLSNLAMAADSSKKARDTQNALKDSLTTTQNLLNEYLQMSREREEWWSKQLKKERARQHFWEESLATVVKEGEDLEKELRQRSRRRGSRVFGPSLAGTISGAATAKGRPSLLAMTTPGGTVKQVPLAVVEEPPSPQDQSSPPASGLTPRYPQPMPPVPATSSIVPAETASPLAVPSLPSRSGTTDTIVGGRRGIPHINLEDTKVPLVVAEVALDDHEYDTDEEDEFFDAIESGNLPNLIVHEGLTSPTTDSILTPRSSTTDVTSADVVAIATLKGPLPKNTNVEPFAGYAHLRSRLSIRDDERPSTSLWSVLKHSIGKDLTKISFPVFFNEPTSMLQRMVSGLGHSMLFVAQYASFFQAEDMEFSECCESQSVTLLLHILRRYISISSGRRSS